MSRIPEQEYVDWYGDCVTDDLLRKYHTQEEIKNFYRWMTGQTMGLTEEGKTMYYACDYERWLHGLPIID